MVEAEVPPWSTQNDLGAVSIELTIYKIVLFGVVLPIFGLITPIFIIHQAVVDIYRLARRIAALGGRDMPQVEQINFEGHAFLIASAAVTCLAVTAFAVRFSWGMLRDRTIRALPDAQGDRRFRAIPTRLLPDIQAKVVALWKDIGSGRRPELLCFASTSSAACVTEIDGAQAIALSTGLIDQFLKGDERLAQVILLHEMAHVVGGDIKSFQRLTAFVEAFRWVFLVFLVTTGFSFAISIPAEYLNLAGIEERSPSLPAFITGNARDLIFAYISILLVLRYVALLVMLTELRADLRAAMALGSFSMFASTVRSASGFRPSSRIHLLQSWVGTKVSHLTAGERLDLLERPSRLFTPKYRYFAASIGLCLFLILDGAIAFSGFDWILQVGIIATVAGLNAITIAMIIANDFRGLRRIGFARMFAIATMVVAANLIFLFFPSDVMGTTDTVIVAITDPNFSYTANTVVGEWYAASAKPAVDALLDGRAALWITSILLALWCCARFHSRRRSRIIAAGACIFAACVTLVISAGSPFGTYLLLPERFYDVREPISQFMMTIGPPAPVVMAAALGVLLTAVDRLFGLVTTNAEPTFP